MDASEKSAEAVPWQGDFAAIDTSDSKRMGEALRASETRFRALIENAHDLIAITDVKGVVTYNSPSVTTLFGDLKGMVIFDLVHPDDLAKARAVLAECLTRPGEPITFERRCRALDGSWRTIEAVVANWLDEPAIAGILMIGRDITDRRETETQLRHSQRLETVAQLTAGIAHDFNNVLSVILSGAELIAAAAPADGDIRTDAQNIRAAALNGTALIHRLMTYTRQMELTIAPRDLMKVVVEIAEMLQRILPKQVNLDLRLGGESLASLIDPSAVHQVVMNLATNARDAMPGGGTLTISLFTMELDAAGAARYHWLAPGRFHGVRVADSGTGMTPEVRARVFDPFFTTKEPGKGTGLGMPMVQAIMQQHGGFVELSTAPGKGTIVSVHFPASKPVVEPVQPPQEIRKGEGQRILLVEDEEPLRRAAKRILERSGYLVAAAGDGVQALEMINDNPVFDLIISDVQMPNLDGLALHDAVRRKGLRMPFLFLSGNPVQEMRAKADQDDRTAFLQKPWTLDNMKRAVLDILGTAR